jgi:hypothetical protein
LAYFIGFLLRDETGRIDGQRLLEVGQRFLQFAAAQKQLAFMNVCRRGQKAHIFVRGTVRQVCGF